MKRNKTMKVLLLGLCIVMLLGMTCFAAEEGESFAYNTLGCAASCNRHRFGPDHQGSLFLSVPGYCCWRRYVCQLQFHGYDHPYL